jgi:glyoxylase-like metal-dependent hydrolase (beta-lactamase superfamily II)
MRRITPLLVVLSAVSLFGCRTSGHQPVRPAPAAPAPQAADLQVSELRPGVWLHVSWQTFPDGTRVPSNGLIVREGDQLLLVDTAWGEALTAQLLDWIEANLRLPVTRAVVTHSHHDRIGGSAALLSRGIRISTHPLTRQLASEQGLPIPEALAELAEIGSTARVGPAELFYPGPGHTRDNLMVWLPESRVLFSGCAVRAASAKGLGNVAHADTAAWPSSIQRALERYGTAEVVVPGHGDAGGPELLRHTLSLFQR